MNVLVTGGAGFIGSHIATALVGAGHNVRVLDDLSGGYLDNVPASAEFFEGDVAEERTVRKAVDDIACVFHLAAHRAVARSVSDPLATDTANTHGTLTVLKAALDAGVKRVIYSSSSSVYGGAEQLPTPETAPACPRSPYAVSKLAGEQYCRVFAELFGMETVSLRYFNVFGPRQRPDSAYAAVIPLFIDALRRGDPSTIHGDGHQMRAFTFIDDVVLANIAIAGATSEVCRGQVYNVAAKESHSILDVLQVLAAMVGVEAAPVHVESRPGDIRDSSADISAAERSFGFQPQTSFEDGLRRTLDWFDEQRKVLP